MENKTMTRNKDAKERGTNRTALLNVKQAAEFLGFHKGTLDVWRLQRTGPQYIKIGRAIRYAMDDLEKYVADRKRSA